MRLRKQSVDGNVACAVRLELRLLPIRPPRFEGKTGKSCHEIQLGRPYVAHLNREHAGKPVRGNCSLPNDFLRKKIVLRCVKHNELGVDESHRDVLPFGHTRQIRNAELEYQSSCWGEAAGNIFETLNLRLLLKK